MKKKMFFGTLLLLLAFLTACGAEQGKSTEGGFSMVFENDTGKDVSALEIRPAGTSEWSPITLADKQWKSDCEIPVMLSGNVPEARNGWQVQMTFAEDGEKAVWEDVEFWADASIRFFVKDGEHLSAVAEEKTETVEKSAKKEKNS